MIKSRFESIGLYLPERVVTTRELLSQMNKKPEFDFEKITGIKERRVLSDSENSLTLAIDAAKNCLKNSQYVIGDIDVIIYTSITRHVEGLKMLFDPPISLLIKKELGAHKAINFDISNACAGMITGAYALNSMIQSGIVKNGLIVSGESISHIANTAVKEIENPIDEQFASLTVGDSGAAIILDKSPNEDEGIDFIDLITFAEHAHLCYGMPSKQNPGIAMYTKSTEMHRVAIDNWPILLEETLKKLGKDFHKEEYDFIILHQTSTRAIHAFMKAGEDHFRKEMPQSLFSVEKFGNTSSTSHFVVMYNGIKEKKIKKGSKIIFIPLASGMVIGCLSAIIGELKV